MRNNSIGKIRRDVDSLADSHNSLKNKVNILGAVVILLVVAVTYLVIAV